MIIYNVVIISKSDAVEIYKITDKQNKKIYEYGND